jgi:hypothetical protein
MKPNTIKEDKMEEKRKVGRPPLEQTMNPEWYTIIIEAGKTGKHITHFLTELGISWEGHHKLLKRNPKYNEAVQEYQKTCEEFWYNMAHKAMSKDGGVGFNSRLWSLIVRNKFPQHWSESTKVDVTTQGQAIDKQPITIEIVKTKLEE